MNLPLIDGIRRADRDNAIDLYIGEDYMDVLAEEDGSAFLAKKPPVFTKEEKGHGWTAYDGGFARRSFSEIILTGLIKAV